MRGFWPHGPPGRAGASCCLHPQRLFPKGEEQAGHDWQGPPPPQGCLRASSEAQAGAETAPSEARPWMWRQI